VVNAEGTTRCLIPKISIMLAPFPSSPPTAHYFESQHLKLHYMDWGNRDAPPLIMQHGGRDHCRSWDWVAQQFRADWHVITPDLRGHGDSAWSPDCNYGPSLNVLDLATLIDQLQLSSVSIIGHSLGAQISLRYAGIYPERVRQLVEIEGAWLRGRSTMARMKMPIAERMRDWIASNQALSRRNSRGYPSFAEALERMKAENRRLSAEHAEYLTRHGLRQDIDGTFTWKFDNCARGVAAHDITTAELIELWSQIKCPILRVYGRDSWAFASEVFTSTGVVPNAEMVILEDAGHWVHLDQLDKFIDLTRQFLKLS
jgi:pimeloyl-ACP methyl ester carboxylesterase